MDKNRKDTIRYKIALSVYMLFYAGPSVAKGFFCRAAPRVYLAPHVRLNES